MNKPECRTNPYGTKEWFLNGKLHREDGPAYEGSDGSKSWWLNGKRHREDAPAVEWSNGAKEWYLNGKRHREDGPAVEGPDGSKSWWLNGKATHPEKLVDLWLEREVFCWYDETTETLNFGEKDEQA
jgi:hypothetical protein